MLDILIECHFKPGHIIDTTMNVIAGLITQQTVKRSFKIILNNAALVDSLKSVPNVHTSLYFLLQHGSNSLWRIVQ